eukprot:14288546-Alexandrium_andersonii.AAC.1
MSASLVGSEMCIRDRCPASPCLHALEAGARRPAQRFGQSHRQSGGPHSCLLYTSDAADDM